MVEHVGTEEVGTTGSGLLQQALPGSALVVAGIAWGLSTYCGPFIDRDRELRARGMAPIQARVAITRHACRLTYRMLKTQQPFDDQRYRQGRHPSER